MWGRGSLTSAGSMQLGVDNGHSQSGEAGRGGHAVHHCSSALSVLPNCSQPTSATVAKCFMAVSSCAQVVTASAVARSQSILE